MNLVRVSRIPVLSAHSCRWRLPASHSALAAQPDMKYPDACQTPMIQCVSLKLAAAIGSIKYGMPIKGRSEDQQPHPDPFVPHGDRPRLRQSVRPFLASTFLILQHARMAC